MYLVKKGQSTRQVRRPIKDSVLHLWEEMMLNCGSEDYLISQGLVPGPGINKKPIRAEQLTRRWRRHVKGKIFIQQGENKVYIKADMYSLKHSNTTETMEELESSNYNNYQPENDVAKLNGHTSPAMVVGIYDVRNKQRKDDKIKGVKNKF